MPTIHLHRHTDDFFLHACFLWMYVSFYVLSSKYNKMRDERKIIVWENVLCVVSARSRFQRRDEAVEDHSLQLPEEGRLAARVPLVAGIVRRWRGC